MTIKIQAIAAVTMTVLTNTNHLNPPGLEGVDGGHSTLRPNPAREQHHNVLHILPVAR